MASPKHALDTMFQYINFVPIHKCLKESRKNNTEENRQSMVRAGTEYKNTVRNLTLKSIGKRV